MTMITQLPRLLSFNRDEQADCMTMTKANCASMASPAHDAAYRLKDRGLRCVATAIALRRDNTYKLDVDQPRNTHTNNILHRDPRT